MKPKTYTVGITSEGSVNVDENTEGKDNTLVNGGEITETDQKNVKGNEKGKKVLF